MVLDPQQLDRVLDKQTEADGDIYRNRLGTIEIKHEPTDRKADREKAKQEMKDYILRNLDKEICIRDMVTSADIQGTLAFKYDIYSGLRTHLNNIGYADKTVKRNNRGYVTFTYVGRRVLNPTKTHKRIMSLIKKQKDWFPSKDIASEMNLTMSSKMRTYISDARFMMEQEGYRFEWERRNKTIFWRVIK